MLRKIEFLGYDGEANHELEPTDEPQLLARAVAFIVEEEFFVHSLLVVRNGYVVADAYFCRFTPDTQHDLASCTKSFSSSLIGIAIDKGYIGVELPLGLDGTYRIGPGRFGIPAALEGSWQKDDLFVVNLNEIGNINSWIIEMRFEGNEVTLSIKDATGLGSADFGGRLQD
jgi:hypothetical protein